MKELFIVTAIVLLTGAGVAALGSRETPESIKQAVAKRESEIEIELLEFGICRQPDGRLKIVEKDIMQRILNSQNQTASKITDPRPGWDSERAE